MAEEPAEDPGDKGGRGNLVGAIVVIVLVVAVIWLAHVLYKNLQLQKCELEGRHDCTDLPQPDQ
jgi:hypothetical protein